MNTSLRASPISPSSSLEQLARGTDERQALLILVRARRLADEHQVGVGVTGSEHDAVASRGQLGHRSHADAVANTALSASRRAPASSDATGTATERPAETADEDEPTSRRS